jgi:hypothetical protein
MLDILPESRAWFVWLDEAPSFTFQITVGTVKSHVNHIYGKLGVNSHSQAIARAHTLQLL